MESAVTFKTRNSRLAHDCRRAQRSESQIVVSALVHGRLRQITGRILNVAIVPNSLQDLTWEITIAESRARP